MTHTSQGLCWLDGKILPVEQATIPISDHGLLYGDGVFEGVRFYHRQPFLLDHHLDRLQDSARAIALEYPWDHAQFRQIVQSLIDAFDAPNGYLRILLTRGSGALGIDPRQCHQPRLAIICDHLDMIDPSARNQGANLIIAATRRLPPDGLDPRIKSLNYLNHILARIEANHAGADEAILLNPQGHVAEGTADNLFIVRHGELFTPPTTDGALAGVTRGLILELARDNHIPAHERSLAPYDLYTADECFLTGTGAELIPVKSIDGRPLNTCPGPLYSRLQQQFRNTIETHCKPDTP